MERNKGYVHKLNECIKDIILNVESVILKMNNN